MKLLDLTNFYGEQSGGVRTYYGKKAIEKAKAYTWEAAFSSIFEHYIKFSLSSKASVKRRLRNFNYEGIY